MTIGSNLIRGHLDSIILKLIIEKDRYGYEIASEIATRTNRAFVIKEATLYSLVQRLEKKEFISSYIGTKSHGSKRRYYKITPLGIDYYQEKVLEWEMLRDVMSKFLEASHE